MLYMQIQMFFNIFYCIRFFMLFWHFYSFPVRRKMTMNVSYNYSTLSTACHLCSSLVGNTKRFLHPTNVLSSPYPLHEVLFKGPPGHCTYLLLYFKAAISV